MLKKARMTFDDQVRVWASTACKEWGFPESSQDLFAKLNERFPNGLRKILDFGIENGIVVVDGCTFKIRGMNQSKGPYNWFSRDKTKRKLNPNWEYYIQVAEYIRLCRAFGDEEYVLAFEDALMDIGIYKNNRLLVCCEIKEKSSQAKKLIAGIKMFQAVFPFEIRSLIPLPGHKDRGIHSLGIFTKKIRSRRMRRSSPDSARLAPCHLFQLHQSQCQP
jgi:hypothetical protein